MELREGKDKEKGQWDEVKKKWGSMQEVRTRTDPDFKYGL